MKYRTENKILCQKKAESGKEEISNRKKSKMIRFCFCCTFVTTLLVFFLTRSVSVCFGFVSVLGVGFLSGLPVVGKVPDKDSSSVETSD